jgi:hypothetical protein
MGQACRSELLDGLADDPGPTDVLTISIANSHRVPNLLNNIECPVITMLH